MAPLRPEAIAAQARWLVGYSDLTAAHVLWQQAGLASLDGVMATALTGWQPAARRELLTILRQPRKTAQHFAPRVLWCPTGLAALADLLQAEGIAIPAMYGLPVGHGPTSRPLLLGARATVDFSAERVRVEATSARARHRRRATPPAGS